MGRARDAYLALLKKPPSTPKKEESASSLEPASPSYQYCLVIDTGGVLPPVRERADNNSAVLMHLGKDDVVKVCGIKNDWVGVQIGAIRGWTLMRGTPRRQFLLPCNLCLCRRAAPLGRFFCCSKCHRNKRRSKRDDAGDSDDENAHDVDECWAKWLLTERRLRIRQDTERRLALARRRASDLSSDESSSSSSSCATTNVEKKKVGRRESRARGTLARRDVPQVRVVELESVTSSTRTEASSKRDVLKGKTVEQCTGSSSMRRKNAVREGGTRAKTAAREMDTCETRKHAAVKGDGIMTHARRRKSKVSDVSSEEKSCTCGNRSEKKKAASSELNTVETVLGRRVRRVKTEEHDSVARTTRKKAAVTGDETMVALTEQEINTCNTRTKTAATGAGVAAKVSMQDMDVGSAMKETAAKRDGTTATLAVQRISTSSATTNKTMKRDDAITQTRRRKSDVSSENDGIMSGNWGNKSVDKKKVALSDLRAIEAVTRRNVMKAERVDQVSLTRRIRKEDAPQGDLLRTHTAVCHIDASCNMEEAATRRNGARIETRRCQSVLSDLSSEGTSDTSGSSQSSSSQSSSSISSSTNHAGAQRYNLMDSGTSTLAVGGARSVLAADVDAEEGGRTFLLEPSLSTDTEHKGSSASVAISYEVPEEGTLPPHKMSRVKEPWIGDTCASNQPIDGKPTSGCAMLKTMAPINVDTETSLCCGPTPSREKLGSASAHDAAASSSTTLEDDACVRVRGDTSHAQGADQAASICHTTTKVEKTHVETNLNETDGRGGKNKSEKKATHRKSKKTTTGEVLKTAMEVDTQNAMNDAAAQRDAEKVRRGGEMAGTKENAPRVKAVGQQIGILSTRMETSAEGDETQARTGAQQMGGRSARTEAAAEGSGTSVKTVTEDSVKEDETNAKAVAQEMETPSTVTKKSAKGGERNSKTVTRKMDADSAKREAAVEKDTTKDKTATHGMNIHSTKNGASLEENGNETNSLIPGWKTSNDSTMAETEANNGLTEVNRNMQKTETSSGVVQATKGVQDALMLKAKNDAVVKGDIVTDEAMVQESSFGSSKKKTRATGDVLKVNTTQGTETNSVLHEVSATGKERQTQTEKHKAALGSAKDGALADAGALVVMDDVVAEKNITVSIGSVMSLGALHGSQEEAVQAIDGIVLEDADDALFALFDGKPELRTASNNNAYTISMKGEYPTLIGERNVRAQADKGKLSPRCFVTSSNTTQLLRPLPPFERPRAGSPEMKCTGSAGALMTRLEPGATSAPVVSDVSSFSSSVPSSVVPNIGSNAARLSVGVAPECAIVAEPAKSSIVPDAAPPTAPSIALSATALSSVSPEEPTTERSTLSAVVLPEACGNVRPTTQMVSCKAQQSAPNQRKPPMPANTPPPPSPVIVAPQKFTISTRPAPPGAPPIPKEYTAHASSKTLEARSPPVPQVAPTPLMAREPPEAPTPPLLPARSATIPTTVTTLPRLSRQALRRWRASTFPSSSSSSSSSTSSSSSSNSSCSSSSSGFSSSSLDSNSSNSIRQPSRTWVVSDLSADTGSRKVASCEVLRTDTASSPEPSLTRTRVRKAQLFTSAQVVNGSSISQEPKNPGAVCIKHIAIASSDLPNVPVARGAAHSDSVSLSLVHHVQVPTAKGKPSLPLRDEDGSPDVADDAPSSPVRPAEQTETGGNKRSSTALHTLDTVLFSSGRSPESQRTIKKETLAMVVLSDTKVLAADLVADLGTLNFDFIMVPIKSQENIGYGVLHFTSSDDLKAFSQEKNHVMSILSPTEAAVLRITDSFTKECALMREKRPAMSAPDAAKTSEPMGKSTLSMPLLVQDSYADGSYAAHEVPLFQDSADAGFDGGSSPSYK